MTQQLQGGGNGCESYTDSDASHGRVYVASNTAVDISYGRVSGSEKANLTVLRQLDNGGWGQIWGKGDIQPTVWGTYFPAVSVPASNSDFYLSATAEASNPQNGQSLGTMQYGQYCVQLDAATDSVTSVLLYLSPHFETNLVNTVVMYKYTPAIPNNQFKRY